MPLIPVTDEASHLAFGQPILQRPALNRLPTTGNPPPTSFEKDYATWNCTPRS